MTHPSIIFGMPHVVGLADLIEEALIHQGFDVISLPKISRRVSYPSLSARIFAHWRKCLGDKETAKRLKGETLLHELSGSLKQQKADFALFISGDIYSPDVLRFAQQNSRHGSTNYQFDGMHRQPAIYERIALFDRFYAFDPNDVKQYDLLFASNFYFDHLPDFSGSVKPKSVYFFGSHQDNRAHTIVQFAQQIQALNYDNQIHIVCKNATQRNHYSNSEIKMVTRGISFRENINNAQQAEILVDFVAPDHSGLSFRPFEALGYRKKLITTNENIQYYDFYHPDNIFIWHNDTQLENLKTWLTIPYHEIAPEIYKKYAFSNWIKYILNIEPHQKITLPNIQAA